MNTRQNILEAVLKNQPPLSPLSQLNFFNSFDNDLVEKYMEILTSIGGKVFLVNDYDAIKNIVVQQFDINKRIATNLEELSDIADRTSEEIDPHSFNDIELMLMKAHFAVAENGAVWLTEKLMGQRILPFICQHLAVIINASDILPTMQHAYARIGNERYQFGSFIAGPSKTADIEQALVLGAHGPRTMTAFIMTD